MECNQILARMNAYADGELSRFQRRRFARHLEVCTSCRDNLAGLREVYRILGELPMPPLPEDLAGRVMAEAIRSAPKVEHLSPVDRLSEWLNQALQAMSLPVRVAACSTVIAASLVGILMAGRIAPADGRQGVEVAVRELDGLEWFGSAPPVSVAAAYLVADSGSPQAEEYAR